jgi:ribonuclease BN (tRNA processing enzyme)
LAQAAQVKTLVLFHHDPSHDDVAVQELENLAQRDFAHARAAREGLKLEI